MSVTITDHMYETALLHGEDAHHLMWAIIDYAERGIEPDQSEEWYRTFFALKGEIDRSVSASINGAKGGRPKKVTGTDTSLSGTEERGVKANSENPENHPFETTETTLNNHDSVTTINNSNKSKVIRSNKFIPPTTDEVEAYCEEWGHTIDAGAFVDFYTSKGWKVGSQPMKDWKAAVRNWWRTDHKRGQDRLNAKPDKFAKFGV